MEEISWSLPQGKITGKSGWHSIEAFKSASRYLDVSLNIDNIYFDHMVDRIYPTELQLNKDKHKDYSSDTEAPFGFETIYI